MNGEQIELTRASLHVTFLLLDPPRPLPMTTLTFSYEVKAVAPLSATIDSIGLAYNSGGAPKVCGPGVATVEVDGAEVYRAPYRARRGMCAPTVVLDRTDAKAAVAMDRLIKAKTISVRFATDDGTSTLGDTFKGIEPGARFQTLSTAFENLFGSGSSPTTCREYRSDALEKLFPFQWATRTTPSRN
ncbi:MULTISPECIES: hypothetical protein [unclassified Phenylobacterium]|uniref:hypothetical protein n=1 Tax=unclassified Phenylobacterium TaxID=2640670 RepID=UPI0012E3C681|nr:MULTISPECIES: hypothetical protein [unclassified Phenylobacterium]